MTLRRIVDIINNQLVLTLPESFRGKNKVLVIVDDSLSSKADKFQLMKQASTDPLFLADLKEVGDDFGSIDHETL